MDVKNETYVANKFLLKNCILTLWAICLVEVVSRLVRPD